MTKDQESFFAMCLKVKNFGSKNATQLDTITGVSGFFTQLNTLVTALIAADMGSRTDYSGYTLDKANKRLALQQISLQVSNALASYAVMNNEIVLQKKADFPTSSWYSISEDQLVTQATIVRDLALPYAAQLTGFGAVAADVTSLTTAIATFINVISNPSLVADQRKTSNAELPEISNQIKSLFKDKLDILMRSFEVPNPRLFSLYKSARAIDVNGKIQAPTVAVAVPPHTTSTVHSAALYENNRFYTLQNQGTADVYFSLSEVTNVEGPNPIVLAAGDTRSRLASNLARIGTFLVVKNDTNLEQKIRVWVE